MKILKKSTNPNVGFNISQSALGRFLDCRQKARYALDGWIAKKPSRPLLFGNFFHNCLLLNYKPFSWLFLIVLNT